MDQFTMWKHNGKGNYCAPNIQHCSRIPTTVHASWLTIVLYTNIILLNPTPFAQQLFNYIYISFFPPQILFYFKFFFLWQLVKDVSYFNCVQIFSFLLYLHITCFPSLLFLSLVGLFRSYIYFSSSLFTFFFFQIKVFHRKMYKCVGLAISIS